MQLIDLSHIVQNVKSSQYIVIDRTIVELYRNIREALSGKCVFYLDDPEEQKSFQTFQAGVDYFLENEISRNDHLIVIGGGATSDLGGFIASTVLRGIQWSVYPTTLLSMVDAAIGGKVGINSEFGKNLVGSFHLPQEVFICHEFLSTLPREEMISGQGEILKYAFLSKEIHKLMIQDEKLNLIVKECALFKESIVENDFKESGKRKILNLGHTFGHAIEKVTGIPHGIAVMLGLKLIIDLYSPQLEASYTELLARQDFSFDLPSINFFEFEKYLALDKKSKNDGTIDLIIPIEIGKIEIQNYPLSEVIQKIKNYSLYETFFS